MSKIDRMEKRIIIVYLKNFKYILLVVLMIWFFLIQSTKKDFSIDEGFDDELYLICTHPAMFQCDDLQRVYYICYRGMQEFEDKNCPYFDNKTFLERYIDARRRN